ncbi:MAG: hypothetical protein ABIK30_13385 [bacterium]
MALSSDEMIKREIIDAFGTEYNGLSLWAFPESSNADQLVFGDDGGLTFGVDGVLYGSCDACWVKKETWVNPYNNKEVSFKPIIALEGTDALNRGSSGNAQYQRFHHALGAVKAGIIGVYYLKKGNHKIQEDLYGMAYYASKVEKGTYLIINDLRDLRNLLDAISDKTGLEEYLESQQKRMYSIFKKRFDSSYGDWNEFAKKRSTVIKDKYIIKHSGRMKRNFTDGSQRAGHIAVGEMYLTKYFFYQKHFFYLWPKMTAEDRDYLDEHKKTDKEWALLRNEPNVTILTVDDLSGVPDQTKKALKSISDEPLKGIVLSKYTECVKTIEAGLINNTIKINDAILEDIGV